KAGVGGSIPSLRISLSSHTVALRFTSSFPLGREANLHHAAHGTNSCSKSTQASNVSDPAPGPSIDHRIPCESSKRIGALPKDKSTRSPVRPATTSETIGSKEPLTRMKPASVRLPQLPGSLQPAIPKRATRQAKRTSTATQRQLRST